jgi:methylase of polypeptide subunit release factors
VAFHLLAEGTALLYRGDYHNARQLLTAVEHRIRKSDIPAAATLLERFRSHRQAQAETHRLLSRILVPVQQGEVVELRRAPHAGEAIRQAIGPIETLTLLPLTDVLGMIGAHEWRRKGVLIPFLGDSIHPHYGVYSPLRGEYVDLVAQAPLPRVERAFDVGTGTGVLAVVLAKRGISSIIATDLDPRAIACAEENVRRFGLGERVNVIAADLFPEGEADLVVCNPPWIPERPTSPLERAIYDPQSRVLARFIQELPQHLTPHGEGWLVLSDLAERLGLREAGFVVEAGRRVGLQAEVLSTARPRHPKAVDLQDPLHDARSAEQTHLWRLRKRS